MRRRCVLLVLVLLFGAGCAGSTGPPARSNIPVSASASSVAWMDRFCTIAGDLRTALWGSAADPGGGPGNPAALRDSFDSQLSAAAGALGAAVDQLDTLPADRPPGGAEAAAELSHQLSALRDSIATGQQSLAALPSNASEPDLGRVMGSVWPGVAAKAAKPFDGVPVTEDLKAAAKGPACLAYPELR